MINNLFSGTIFTVLHALVNILLRKPCVSDAETITMARMRRCSPIVSARVNKCVTSDV